MKKNLFIALLLIPFITHAQINATSTTALPVSAIIDKDLLKVKKKDDLLQAKDQLTIERHRPFYFLWGKPTSKVQLSFKSKMHHKVPLYFGYSQQMTWRLSEESKPFEDITYNPELFYRYQVSNNLLRSVDFGFWEHRSNGKKDLDSRSLDRHYIAFHFSKDFPSWIVRLHTKFSYSHNFDETNKDIRDYMGPLELGLTFVQLFEGVIDKGEFSIEYFSGGKYAQKFNTGGVQVGYNFRLGGLDLVPAFFIQYYNGYVENLLRYNTRVSRFRIGIIF